MWSQMGLRSINMNTAIGGDGIPVELFQILKDDAMKVLYSICQQIWKTQQWPQDWKRSVFIPIPKKGNGKECSNYCTIVLISNASKVMQKILQTMLQQVCEPWNSRCLSCFFFNFYFYLILLYNTLLVLPYIDMNPPRVYMHSQTWTTPRPPPSP